MRLPGVFGRFRGRLGEASLPFAPLPLALLAGCLLLAGCGDNMSNQNKIEDLEPASSLVDIPWRPLPVPGTVARDDMDPFTPLFSGRDAGGKFLARAPINVDLKALQNGRQLYNIHCIVCHGPEGHGDGIVVRRGFPNPPDYSDPRVLSAPDGYLFDVITHGYGVMYPYGYRMTPTERWHVVAYIRALEMAQVPDAFADAGQAADAHRRSGDPAASSGYSSAAAGEATREAAGSPLLRGGPFVLAGVGADAARTSTAHNGVDAHASYRAARRSAPTSNTPESGGAAR